MENRSHAIIAGLFTILLGIAIAASFWWMSGTDSERLDYYIISKLPVAGLNSQAKVQFRGVTVGQVSTIEFDPANPMNIMIKISVDKALKLTHGTYAKLKSQGLTGLSYVELDDSGNDPQLLVSASADQKIPLTPSDMENLIDSGKFLVEQSKVLVANSMRLVESGNQLFDPRNLERIEHVLENLDKSTQALSPLLANMAQTTQRVNTLLSDDHQQRILTVADDAHLVLQQTAPLIQDMRRATTDFHELTAQLQNSSSDISSHINNEALPQINQLTLHLTRNAKRMDSLMQELGQNPQSLIFGKPQPLPGPGEPGFSVQH